MRKVRILQILPDVHPAQDGSKVSVLSLQDSDRIVLMMFYMDYQQVFVGGFSLRNASGRLEGTDAAKSQATLPARGMTTGFIPWSYAVYHRGTKLSIGSFLMRRFIIVSSAAQVLTFGDLQSHMLYSHKAHLFVCLCLFFCGAMGQWNLRSMFQKLPGFSACSTEFLWGAKTSSPVNPDSPAVIWRSPVYIRMARHHQEPRSTSKHQILRSKIADVGEVLTKQKGEAMPSGRWMSKRPSANVAGCPLLPFVCSDT